jgi:hypothetical protein
MIEVVNDSPTKTEEILKVPIHLVYEKIDGMPLLYKDFRDVLNNQKQAEEIMGSSSLQSIIVYIIGLFVGSKINRKKYYVASNEAGLRIDKDTTFANDIAIFERATTPLTHKYFRVPPKIALEIDIKIDLTETAWNGDMEYMFAKAKKMIAFGTEKVIWISTITKKIMIITSHKHWSIVDFDEDIHILDDCVLNLAQLLQDEDIEF